MVVSDEAKSGLSPSSGEGAGEAAASGPQRLFEAVRRVISDGIDSPGVYDELHMAFYSMRDGREYPLEQQRSDLLSRIGKASGLAGAVAPAPPRPRSPLGTCDVVPGIGHRETHVCHSWAPIE